MTRKLTVLLFILEHFMRDLSNFLPHVASYHTLKTVSIIICIDLSSRNKTLGCEQMNWCLFIPLNISSS